MGRVVSAVVMAPAPGGDWLATWPWPEGFGVPHPRHGKDKEEAAGRLLAFRYRGDVRGRVSCPQPLALP
jgi:hypothetical protein